MICCSLRARLPSFRNVLLLHNTIDDLGLLLALLGFVILIAVPDRCPLEPLDNLLAACEADICVDKSSRRKSVAYDGYAELGKGRPKVEAIISWVCEAGQANGVCYNRMWSFVDEDMWDIRW
jgi:hypothetical protein